MRWIALILLMSTGCMERHYHHGDNNGSTEVEWKETTKKMRIVDSIDLWSQGEALLVVEYDGEKFLVNPNGGLLLLPSNR
jgi:hypothetical protein